MKIYRLITPTIITVIKRDYMLIKIQVNYQQKIIVEIYVDILLFVIIKHLNNVNLWANGAVVTAFVDDAATGVRINSRLIINY